MSTENIQKFLMPPDEGGAYTDEKLAALLAHAQDGKLSYLSCCCLVGSATADHPLRGLDPNSCVSNWTKNPEYHHIELARIIVGFADEVEEEFRQLAYDVPQPFIRGPLKDPILAATQDAKRRERLIPLILAEMQRREAEKLPEPTMDDGYEDEAPWSDSQTEAERQNSIKGR